MAYSLKRKTVVLQAISVIITLSLLVITMMLLDTTGNSFEPQNEASNAWIVPLSIITLTSLLVLILFNLGRAIALLKVKRTGSRFTLRLMTAFSILTIFPVLVISYFSMDFIGQRIDKWYNVPIHLSLNDALELSQKSLNKGSEVHLHDIQKVAEELFKKDPRDYSLILAKWQHKLNAQEIVLLDSQRRIIAYSSDSSDLFNEIPERKIFAQLFNNNTYNNIELGARSGEQYSRVAIQLETDSFSRPYVLTALFPIPQTFSVLAESVQDALYKYEQLERQRKDIKYGFRFALFIIIVLSVLFSLWAAFVYSTRLTMPVRTLLEGTRSVGSGNLQTKLPVSDKDDFSALANSFNDMTANLLSARQESERSRLELQRQRDYLDVVLNHLTSGVLTIDQHYAIKRINSVAAQLLALDITDVKGKSLPTLAKNSQVMTDFVEATLPHIQKNKDKNKNEWKVEFNTLCQNTRQVFVCQGANLPELLDGTQGIVLVFDDITDLIQAEHDAAWSEVAKRLAHEIKNPLTPIQLSAERLRYKLLPELNEKSANLLIRMSETITQQVESMKTMVNAFSDYARTPALQYQRINIKKFITDTVMLYQSNAQKVTIALDLATLPETAIDIHRMRQVLVNLIKNALEALEGKEGDGLIKISAYVSDKDEVVIQIADNGSGIDEKLLPTLYEPYISSKVKGSGLGLAIVKKIIEEHAGKISAKNCEPQGAVFTIVLPIR